MARKPARREKARVYHVHALSPERDALEIRFPRVEGYTSRISAKIRVAWERVPTLTLDSVEVPDETLVKALTTDQGRELSLHGPGASEHLTLDAWRATRRLQELEFSLARALTRRYGADARCDVPSQVLFPQLLRIVQRFLRERVQPLGRRDRKDVFLEPYFTRALDALGGAIVPGEGESQELPRLETHRGPGSTREVDFWTSRSVRATTRSHISHVVADTEKWEQSAAFYLETDPDVIAYAKNANLGFAIPYAHEGETREYLPDFLVRVGRDGGEVGTLILETKGYDPRAIAKVAGTERWVAAVNADGRHGRWAYRLVTSPADTPAAIRSAVGELVNPPVADWRGALDRFVTEVQALYGSRLRGVVLYGSRARGDAEASSDVDTLVLLDQCPDMWDELDRLRDIVHRASLDHGVVLTALPVAADAFERRDSPLLASAHREGVRVA